MATCAELSKLRDLVNQRFGFNFTTTGNFWLPLVCTARGTIYGEVITQVAPNQYHQPYHLPDRHRQPLYRLGFKLLDYLNAPPAVYLLQFDIVPLFENEVENDGKFLFDRLIPFPDQPAIASVGVQEPNLYECHLLCTTNQPIYDLVIKAK